MKTAGAPGADTPEFEFIMESWGLTDYHAWFGYLEQEYEHYLYVFRQGVLTLWFDMSQVDQETAHAIAAGFSVTR